VRERIEAALLPARAAAAAVKRGEPPPPALANFRRAPLGVDSSGFTYWYLDLGRATGAPAHRRRARRAPRRAPAGRKRRACGGPLPRRVRALLLGRSPMAPAAGAPHLAPAPQATCGCIGRRPRRPRRPRAAAARRAASARRRRRPARGSCWRATRTRCARPASGCAATSSAPSSASRRRRAAGPRPPRGAARIPFRHRWGGSMPAGAGRAPGTRRQHARRPRDQRPLLRSVVVRGRACRQPRAA